jgi:hypothetical protein
MMLSDIIEMYRELKIGGLLSVHTSSHEFLVPVGQGAIDPPPQSNNSPFVEHDTVSRTFEQTQG